MKRKINPAHQPLLLVLFIVIIAAEIAGAKFAGEDWILNLVVVSITTVITYMLDDIHKFILNVARKFL